ncbi:FtsX-like permease family protein [Dactylosporangium darangshiense]|uniref:ABC3 transporter permease protein domain-containing protein n=1 Tax=Dactylosporangium darangshiense TaxID=579108 RepID=A0ABP8DMI2_9ACTN
MSRFLLISRLAARDLRRHPGEALMVLLVIAVCAATLTVGLALNGVTDNPYQQTREATAGPDVLAVISPKWMSGQSADPTRLDQLADAPGTTGHSGPYPLAYTVIQAGGHTVDVTAVGRDQSPTAIDQPSVTQGSWVGAGGVVVERGLADALGIHVGDQITVGGRPQRVAGIAVTAGIPVYPSSLCHLICSLPPSMDVPGQRGAPEMGLVWLARPDVTSLATPDNPLSYVLGLRLTDPADASAFVAAHRPTGSGEPFLYGWQSIRNEDNSVVMLEQVAVEFGGGLLSLLAAAGMTVLVGRRMAEQTRRVGLLKAVGGTPGLIAAVLLAEHLVLAVLAAGAGLLLGWLAAQPFSTVGSGLVGTPGAPALTASTVLVVVAMALAVAFGATLGPAVRAARTSTVSALNDAARAPRRRAWVIALSARLPVPLLLGLRLLARRPRRAVLTTLSIAVTVTGIVAMLADRAYNAGTDSGLNNLRISRLSELTAALTVLLVVLAATNTVFITWATVADARRPSALARALGATPQQVAAGLSTAQVLPALAGAALGIPLGVTTYHQLAEGRNVIPPLWQLLAVLLGTLLVVIGLTAVPSRLAARRPVAVMLEAD